MPVPVFCCFCISEKLYRKYSRNCMGQIASTLKSRNEDCAGRRPEGGQPGARQGPGAACPWPAPGCCLGPPGTPSCCLFAYKSPLDLKFTGESPYIHEKFH